MQRRVGERGQGLVEFALLLPMLILITLGALDLGRAYFSYTTLVNAAREGAMYGSLRPADAGGIRSAVNAEIGGGLSGPVQTDIAIGGGQITVTVRHDFSLATTAVIGTRVLPLSAAATMVVQ